VWTASTAPSSRRRTANNEPLTIDELLSYVAELVEPPASPKPRRGFGIVPDVPTGAA
jgi:hypothetical protein